MLPVLIYEPDEAARAKLLKGLDALEGQGLPAMRVNMSTGSPDTMRRAIEAESGITLVIFGIPEGKVLPCTELGSLAMRQNRYNYTLFCLHAPTDLDQLLENCMRPAGILTMPLSEKALAGSLNRILKDYQSLTGDAPSDDCLIVEANGTAYRIAHNQILYLEALDKLLTIHTERQSITVRRSLSALEEALPEAFTRCHRAYVVNTRYIDQANYSDMTLTLTNGDTLPISRGQRAELKRVLEAQKGAQP